ncbi:RNA pseudouridine synthase superfamily protein [Besnoitia besnoiti]|uniref:RNA pseudouridine synthase superfamily protein n=1 Tax=Besnoitia besnoiti TaxID=94643 RepID=A0A2A9MD40_BESBE|nr:RNA pseudouridine synthase superfamily protein [Besnoitia besnoiti]PFH33593.1 RNA pseudouridine synthase superfamily protein [Besnoitia besnoiti]
MFVQGQHFASSSCPPLPPPSFSGTREADEQWSETSRGCFFGEGSTGGRPLGGAESERGVEGKEGVFAALPPPSCPPPQGMPLASHLQGPPFALPAGSASSSKPFFPPLAPSAVPGAPPGFRAGLLFDDCDRDGAHARDERAEPELDRQLPHYPKPYRGAAGEGMPFFPPSHMPDAGARETERNREVNALQREDRQVFCDVPEDERRLGGGAGPREDDGREDGRRDANFGPALASSSHFQSPFPHHYHGPPQAFPARREEAPAGGVYGHPKGEQDEAREMREDGRKRAGVGGADEPNRMLTSSFPPPRHPDEFSAPVAERMLHRGEGAPGPHGGLLRDCGGPGHFPAFLKCAEAYDREDRPRPKEGQGRPPPLLSQEEAEREAFHKHHAGGFFVGARHPPPLDREDELRPFSAPPYAAPLAPPPHFDHPVPPHQRDPQRPHRGLNPHSCGSFLPGFPAPAGDSDRGLPGMFPPPAMRPAEDGKPLEPAGDMVWRGDGAVRRDRCADGAPGPGAGHEGPHARLPLPSSYFFSHDELMHMREREEGGGRSGREGKGGVGEERHPPHMASCVNHENVDQQYPYPPQASARGPYSEHHCTGGQTPLSSSSDSGSRPPSCSSFYPPPSRPRQSSSPPFFTPAQAGPGGPPLDSGVYAGDPVPVGCFGEGGRERGDDGEAERGFAVHVHHHHTHAQGRREGEADGPFYMSPPPPFGGVWDREGEEKKPGGGQGPAPSGSGERREDPGAFQASLQQGGVPAREAECFNSRVCFPPHRMDGSGAPVPFFMGSRPSPSSRLPNSHALPSAAYGCCPPDGALFPHSVMHSQLHGPARGTGGPAGALGNKVDPGSALKPEFHGRDRDQEGAALLAPVVGPPGLGGFPRETLEEKKRRLPLASPNEEREHLHKHTEYPGDGVPPTPPHTVGFSGPFPHPMHMGKPGCDEAPPSLPLLSHPSPCSSSATGAPEQRGGGGVRDGFFSDASAYCSVEAPGGFPSPGSLRLLETTGRQDREGEGVDGLRDANAVVRRESEEERAIMMRQAFSNDPPLAAREARQGSSYSSHSATSPFVSSTAPHPLPGFPPLAPSGAAPLPLRPPGGGDVGDARGDAPHRRLLGERDPRALCDRAEADDQREKSAGLLPLPFASPASRRASPALVENTAPPELGAGTPAASPYSNSPYLSPEGAGRGGERNRNEKTSEDGSARPSSLLGSKRDGRSLRERELEGLHVPSARFAPAGGEEYERRLAGTEERDRPRLFAEDQERDAGEGANQGAGGLGRRGPEERREEGDETGDAKKKKREKGKRNSAGEDRSGESRDEAGNDRAAEAPGVKEDRNRADERDRASASPSSWGSSQLHQERNAISLGGGNSSSKEEEGSGDVASPSGAASSRCGSFPSKAAVDVQTEETMMPTSPQSSLSVGGRDSPASSPVSSLSGGGTDSSRRGKRSGDGATAKSQGVGAAGRGKAEAGSGGRGTREDDRVEPRKGDRRGGGAGEDAFEGGPSGEGKAAASQGRAGLSAPAAEREQRGKGPRKHAAALGEESAPEGSSPSAAPSSFKGDGEEAPRVQAKESGDAREAPSGEGEEDGKSREGSMFKSFSSSSFSTSQTAAGGEASSVAKTAPSSSVASFSAFSSRQREPFSISTSLAAMASPLPPPPGASSSSMNSSRAWGVLASSSSRFEFPPAASLASNSETSSNNASRRPSSGTPRLSSLSGSGRRERDGSQGQARSSTSGLASTTPEIRRASDPKSAGQRSASLSLAPDASPAAAPTVTAATPAAAAPVSSSSASREGSSGAAATRGRGVAGGSLSGGLSGAAETAASALGSFFASPAPPKKGQALRENTRSSALSALASGRDTPGRRAGVSARGGGAGSASSRVASSTPTTQGQRADAGEEASGSSSAASAERWRVFSYAEVCSRGGSAAARGGAGGRSAANSGGSSSLRSQLSMEVEQAKREGGDAQSKSGATGSSAPARGSSADKTTAAGAPAASSASSVSSASRASALSGSSPSSFASRAARPDGAEAAKLQPWGGGDPGREGRDAKGKAPGGASLSTGRGEEDEAEGARGKEAEAEEAQEKDKGTAGARRTPAQTSGSALRSGLATGSTGSRMSTISSTSASLIMDFPPSSSSNGSGGSLYSRLANSCSLLGSSGGRQDASNASGRGGGGGASGARDETDKGGKAGALASAACGAAASGGGSAGGGAAAGATGSSSANSDCSDEEEEVITLLPKELASPKKEPEVLWEGDGLTVIDKPPGWHCSDVRYDPQTESRQLCSIVNSSRPEPLGLYCSLRFNYPTGKLKECNFGLGHRLDVDTSGPIIIAQTLEAWQWIRDQMHKRNISKEYICLCHGTLAEGFHVIDSPIITSTDGRRLQSYIHHAGQPSLTVVKPLAHLEHKELRYPSTHMPLQFTLNWVKIHTGRTHQIRVHLQSLVDAAGRPHCLVSDDKYGNGQQVEDFQWCRRLFLHQHRLSFRDLNDTPQCFVSPLRADLLSALRHLRVVRSMHEAWHPVRDYLLLGPGQQAPQPQGSNARTASGGRSAPTTRPSRSDALAPTGRDAPAGTRAWGASAGSAPAASSSDSKSSTEKLEIQVTLTEAEQKAYDAACRAMQQHNQEYRRNVSTSRCCFSSSPPPGGAGALGTTPYGSSLVGAGALSVSLSGGPGGLLLGSNKAGPGGLPSSVLYGPPLIKVGAGALKNVSHSAPLVPLLPPISTAMLGPGGSPFHAHHSALMLSHKGVLGTPGGPAAVAARQQPRAGAVSSALGAMSAASVGANSGSGLLSAGNAAGGNDDGRGSGLNGAGGAPGGVSGTSSGGPALAGGGEGTASSRALNASHARGFGDSSLSASASAASSADSAGGAGNSARDAGSKAEGEGRNYDGLLLEWKQTSASQAAASTASGDGTPGSRSSAGTNSSLSGSPPYNTSRSLLGAGGSSRFFGGAGTAPSSRSLAFAGRVLPASGPVLGAATAVGASSAGRPLPVTLDAMVLGGPRSAPSGPHAGAPNSGSLRGFGGGKESGAFIRTFRAESSRADGETSHRASGAGGGSRGGPSASDHQLFSSLGRTASCGGGRGDSKTAEARNAERGDSKADSQSHFSATEAGSSAAQLGSGSSAACPRKQLYKEVLVRSNKTDE